MKTTPKAVIEALKLIRSETGRTIPEHRVSLVLTAEPDQYRVSFTDPRPSALDREFNLVRTLTITPAEFEAWQSWLDGRYPGGRP
ncbi:hypothetical protein EDF19_0493 [Curtobacterium sp. PhB115]|nr:hypothetical protein EDF19_0493 [Curtobacterium sp. PhB115]